MLGAMDKLKYTELGDEFIDITPKQRGRGRRIKWFILGALLFVILLLNGIGIYTESLWFDSLGFASRFWYVFGLRWALFAVFGILTVAILRGGFYILERVFGAEVFRPRRIIVNQQPLDFSLGRFLRPASWIISLVFGIGFGLSLSGDWNAWMLYLHQPATTEMDPIFNKPIGFYLFTLPIYNEIASWLTSMAVLLLAGAVAYAVLSAVPDLAVTEENRLKFSGIGKRAYAVVSAALAALLLIIAWRTILSRYDYLWTDHSSFSGVTYTEANYLLPGLVAVAVALVVAAIVLFVNAFTKKGGRLFFVALGIPIAVYVVAVMLIPAYVQSFVVKPNELGRETPYIENNIAGTRVGFNIENVEAREYAAEITPDSLDLAANRRTLSN